MPQKPPEDLPRAISIRQPYVEMILRGTKRAEYRSRATKVRGRVYLYASLKLAEADARGVRDLLSLPRGLIVGSVEIVGCVAEVRGRLRLEARQAPALPDSSTRARTTSTGLLVTAFLAARVSSVRLRIAQLD